jgi:cytochrome o ubiquinol oxidase subunit IV
MKPASIDRASTTPGSLGSYATGFALSLILTAIPFVVVMDTTLSPPATIAAIFGAALVQMLVHLYYFLHVNFSPRSRWNLLALVLTALIVILFVGGTIWIMSHLNYRLM